MLNDEIVSKGRGLRLGCLGFNPGKTGCIGLAHWLAQMDLCTEARREVVLDVALPDVAHRGSSRSVACLKDARLERSLECQRREGGERAAVSSIRQHEPACRRRSSRRTRKFAALLK